jgi:hypothetical protein
MVSPHNTTLEVAMVITIVSASEFEAYEPNAATAVLRIYDPIEEWTADAARQAEFGWGRFAALAFWDIGHGGIGLLESVVIRLLGNHRRACLALGQKLFGDEIPWRPFLAADARDICCFADSLAPAGVQSVLVVCKNGRARGGTVGNWIARYLGLDLPPQNGWQRESEVITRALARVCRQRRQERAPLPTLATFAH